MSNWHYAEGSQQKGPLAEEELKQMISSGQLTATTKVWKEGMPDWVAADTLPEFSGLGSIGVSAQPVPPQTTTPYQSPTVGNSLHSGASAAGPMPETYLWQAIVATVCCCQIPGIVAIVFAAQVSSKYATGDYYGAQKASDTAKTWCLVAAGLWILAAVGYGILVAVSGVR